VPKAPFPPATTTFPLRGAGGRPGGYGSTTGDIRPEKKPNLPAVHLRQSYPYIICSNTLQAPSNGGGFLNGVGADLDIAKINRARDHGK
jgi:hypothetical protein